ncbi:hypothetical protein ANN_06101 [Periplaneta americana]|uniref:non-specific serine/threonine protein kinase n=1 Tax=Periplaneta americana TaxID=6978 RepID=A0ABQ8TCP6_PERAM|nr:hypothetical protein ANN_06101 [Periplaneta americana]
MTLGYLSPGVYAIGGYRTSNKNPVQEWDDPVLLLSTLDGSLYGVGQKTGYIRWKLKDEPVVKVPVDTTKAIVPLFLPDPKDGSLYVLGSSDREALKKLPFTIPQKKMDTWFAVDPDTGVKQEILSFDKADKTCPLDSSDAIFIGRTEYNIMMFDSKQKERRWNVTFYDYSSSVMDAERLNNYEFVHFTASSTGRTLSLDRRIGTFLWEQNYGSPVIAMYMLEKEGLVSVPFTSVAEETLDHLVTQFTSSTDQIRISDNMKLYPTLYVGEHLYGLYALPSLVDQNTVTIGPAQTGLLLLEGPSHLQATEESSTNYRSSSSSSGLPLPGHNVRLSQSANHVDIPLTFQSLPKEKNEITTPTILLGYYKVPDYSKSFLQITGRSDKVIASPESLIVDDNETNFERTEKAESVERDNAEENEARKQSSIGIQTDDEMEGSWEKLTFYFSKNFVSFSYGSAKLWLNQQENKGLKLLLIILVGCIFAMFWYFNAQVREFQQLSQGSRSSNRSSSGGRNLAITALAEDVGGGNVQVGKITFNTNEILGNGCEGTFVFKGMFDNRAVAVKRLLPECFTFADREVDLLRESDEHGNVVRYFCMEQDKQFRYIALELCAATLQDYVERKFECTTLSPLEILHQATAGLEHLHSLDIVSSTQKFLVQQHITTSKHQANKQLNSKQRQLFLTQPTTSNVRSEFNIDLCRSLISADIPLYKLKNKVFREFLEKYTQHTIPDESTLRKTYAPSIYDETIQKIRDEIKDSSIWVSIDETPDKEGRLVGNVVIGLLSEQYSERILLHCDVLEKCNNKTIVKLFNEAMGILWPKGIMYDNVLFFISDAAPYMVKAGQALSVVYPKLTHFTCVAHAFHRVAEVVRDNFPKVDLLISSVKKVFLKAPSRVNVLKEMYPEIPLPPKPILTRWGTWLEAVEYYAEHIDSINNVLLALDSEDAVSIDTAKTVTCDICVKNDLAHIQHTFSCIIKTLKSLQNRHLSLSESFEIINSTVEQLNRGRGKVADAVRAKVDTVLSKNPGYEELQKVVAVMSGESTVKINLDLSPADIVKLNYVPVTSCDVERSFSQYKSILRDNRRRFTFQHLKEMFVTYCYVHRDIKPHNVLLSMPNAKGEVRAMISDFGLCKKLKVGRMSFSRRSGVAGTDGWIAPEMLNGNSRTTCAVDIFSLGCVFYYVLSNGKHPFGDALRRQGNIISGDFRLSELEGEEKLLQKILVEQMISTDPMERPPASAVRLHPIFWNKCQVLTFFQDVSDRVEKDDQDSPVLQALETGAYCVVKEDWRNVIDSEVAQDLRKYRNYRGSSVRDLLRALRNKKHHYRELSEEAQQSLGEIPNKFIDYWTQRFPLLLLHSWITMQCVKDEPIFSQYYHKNYTFNHDLYIAGSKNVCSAYKYTVQTEDNFSAMQHWMVRKSLFNTPQRNKLQAQNNIGELLSIEDNNSHVRRGLDSSPNRRRSPKKFQNTGRDSQVSKFQNWRAEGDPVRQLYQRTRDDEIVTDQSLQSYVRPTQEKFVSWRDSRRQIESRTMLNEPTFDKESGFRNKANVELKTDNCLDESCVNSATEGVLIVNSEKEISPLWRQDRLVKKDVKNRLVKKRHRHKSAEASPVWLLPDSSQS